MYMEICLQQTIYLLLLMQMTIHTNLTNDKSFQIVHWSAITRQSKQIN